MNETAKAKLLHLLNTNFGESDISISITYQRYSLWDKLTTTLRRRRARAQLYRAAGISPRAKDKKRGLSPWA